MLWCAGIGWSAKASIWVLARGNEDPGFFNPMPNPTASETHDVLSIEEALWDVMRVAERAVEVNIDFDIVGFCN